MLFMPFAAAFRFVLLPVLRRCFAAAAVAVACRFGAFYGAKLPIFFYFCNTFYLFSFIFMLFLDLNQFLKRNSLIFRYLAFFSYLPIFCK